MKLHWAVAFLAVVLLLVFLPSSVVHAQTYTAYRIQMNSDGSADWTIKQVSSINGTIDALETFQDKVESVVANAQIQTGRSMSAENSSFQVSDAMLTTDSMTTQYMFTWLNFSQKTGSQIVIKDVFSDPALFNNLYGDGELLISYPSNYSMKFVTPYPDLTDNLSQSMQWISTSFFMHEKPTITLQFYQEASAGSYQPNLFIFAGLAVAGAGIGCGLVVTGHRRTRKRESNADTPPFFESEEEKILHVLRSNGGSARQSTIADRCSFSKTHASELLSALEEKGVVQRYKSGREKIVNLSDRTRSKSRLVGSRLNKVDNN